MWSKISRKKAGKLNFTEVSWLADWSATKLHFNRSPQPLRNRTFDNEWREALIGLCWAQFTAQQKQSRNATSHSCFHSLILSTAKQVKWNAIRQFPFRFPFSGVEHMRKKKNRAQHFKYEIICPVCLPSEKEAKKQRHRRLSHISAVSFPFGKARILNPTKDADEVLDGNGGRRWKFFFASFALNNCLWHLATFFRSLRKLLSPSFKRETKSNLS